jgi:hypothetical protein
MADERSVFSQPKMLWKSSPPEASWKVSHVVGDDDRRRTFDLVPDDRQTGVALAWREPAPSRRVERVP